MALYEHIVITRPDMSPQQVEELTEEIVTLVKDGKGKTGRNEYWGLRNLAYPIKKHRKAHYALIDIDAEPAVIHELERKHRINDDIVRFMTVKVDAHSEKPSPVMSKGARDS